MSKLYVLIYADSVLAAFVTGTHSNGLTRYTYIQPENREYIVGVPDSDRMLSTELFRGTKEACEEYIKLNGLKLKP